MRRNKTGFKDSKAFAIIQTMPPGMIHHDKSQDYDVTKSQVVQWIISQPAALWYLFGKARNSGAIVFDPATGTWSGKNNSQPAQGHTNAAPENR